MKFPLFAINMSLLQTVYLQSFMFCLLTHSYRQAQATVLEALPLLNKHGIATKRPDDYFAEMAKSDQHMQKVSCFIITRVLSPPRWLSKTTNSKLLILELQQLVVVIGTQHSCSFFPWDLNPTIGTIKTVFSSSVQIRKKLISKQMILEKSEKAKKLREQRKFGKKVGVCFVLYYYCYWIPFTVCCHCKGAAEME